MTGEVLEVGTRLGLVDKLNSDLMLPTAASVLL